MYSICPKCKSKNVKCVKTEINKVVCECMKCFTKFESKPTKKLAREFNG